jgi:hypothetical protein
VIIVINVNQQNANVPSGVNANLQPTLNGISLEQLEEALKVLENF